MVEKIEIDGETYEVDELDTQLKEQLHTIDFAMKRMKELQNMKTILQRAKNSYISSLKEEVIGSKAGILFQE